MQKKNYVIGIDYGTDSVRSLLVDCEGGEEIATAVFEYPRWKEGKYCDASHNQFRQHPLDYIEGLESTVLEILKNAPQGVSKNVRGISIDTTGSTPVAVNKEGLPLALLPEFKENPNAMFVLWKDHTAIREAHEINELAKTWGVVDYTKYEGGVYSSEWFWAKILHVLRVDEKIRNAAFSWLEHCDWISAYLTGQTNPLSIKRSRCAAGHKAMWHESFDGLPSEEFLVQLDPLLQGLRQRLFENSFTSDQSMGNLSSEWAEKLGLSTDVVIGVGAFDAHMGAVGAEIQPYYLSKVMGTSTCDMLIAPLDEVGEKLVHGICGQVDGSIVPGMLGMEAGQSAFGDIYAWFRDMILKPVEDLLDESAVLDQSVKESLKKELHSKMIPYLSSEAEKIPIAKSGVIALDWLNGRRTPYANQKLTSAIAGLSLSSDAVIIFKSLVEASAFGAKKIVDRFEEEGIKIRGVIGLGGVAKKAPYVMQVIADVFNRPIKIAKSEQACALGAAMFAAVAAGVYPNVDEAQKAMGSGFEATYEPINKNVQEYEKLYTKYGKLGEFVEKVLTTGKKL